MERLTRWVGILATVAACNGKEGSSKEVPSAVADAAPVTAASDSVTIDFAVPDGSIAWAEETTQWTDLTVIDDKGRSVRVKNEAIKKKEVAVLATSDSAVTKARIAFQISETKTINGVPQAVPAPHHGKAYILDATGVELTVTTDKGAAPSADEITAVTKEVPGACQRG